MRCTQLLIQDHQIILRSLDVLQSMAELERRERLDPGDGEMLVQFFRLFADEHHHIKEESVLFPELMRASRSHTTALQHLLFEHDQERSLLEGLEDALHTRKKPDILVFADRLTERIRNHMQKEEYVLFPVAENLFSSEQDEAVIAEFDKYQLAPGLIPGFHSLESKYLRRMTA